jgi:uncharacterized protein YciI
MDLNPSNSRRFIYVYFNRNEPQKIQEVVAAHVQYWKTADLKSYSGGPFADRSGGLISFAAQTLEEATEIILRDPFIQEDLIEQKWIKEWIVVPH